MDDEKEKLLPDDGDLQAEWSADGAKPSSKKVKRGSDEPKPVSLWKLLFSNSGAKEVILMGLGTCAAFLQGTAFPSLSVAFGSMSDSIMNHTLQEMNQTDIYEVHNKTIGDVHFRRVTIEEYEASPDLQDVDVKTSYIESLLLPTIVVDDEYGQGNNALHLGASASNFSIYAFLIGILALLSSVIQHISWKASSSEQHERREEDYYQNVLHQDQAWFDKNKKNDVVKEFSGHLDDIKHGTGTQVSSIIQKLTGFGSGIAVAVKKSWPFALVLIAIVPILTLKSAFNAKFTNQRNRKTAQYRKAGIHALQVFSAIRTVAAFGGEPKEIENYKTELKEDLDIELRRQYKIGFGMAMANFFNYAAYALAFWSAASILAAAMVSAGAIYTILLSLMMGASNLGGALHNIFNVIKAKASAGLVDDVVQAGEETVKESKEGLVLDKLEGRIQFKGVHFQYPVQRANQSAFALKDINMEIEPQTVTAVVGTNSSGKSTVIKLLQRFYEPDEGEIIVDGHPTVALNVVALRKRIGFVPKTPLLFNGTIKENIGCGKLGSSDEEIVEAATKASAHDFISSFPQGYDTIIEDEDAITLSREQKQLISIARVLLLNPDVLVLDCPLLNDQIYPNSTMALGNACEGRTVIIIADRLSDIQFVNQIYVFDDGRIAESGTSDELMEHEGLYSSLLAEEVLMDNLEQMSSEADLEAESKEEYENEDEVNAKSAKHAEEGNVEDAEKTEMEEEVERLNLNLPSPTDILKLNMQEKYSVCVAIIAATVSGASLPMYAVLYAEFFNTFTKTGDDLWQSANFCTIMFLVLACASALANGLQITSAAKAGETLIMRMKANAFCGIIRQSISWFEKPEHTPEKLVKRLAIDAELIRTAGIDLACNAVSAFTTILLSAAVIVYSSWKIGLIVVLIAYPFLLITSFRQSVHKHESAKPTKTGKITAEKIMKDCVANIQCVQELGLEEYFYEKFKKAKAEEEARAALRKQLFTAAKAAFAQTGVFYVYSGVFGAGGFVMSMNLIDGPSLFRIFFSTIFCANGIGSLLAALADHKKGQLAAALVLHLAEIKSDIDPLRTYGKTPRFSGELVISDASFGYSESEPHVDALSFKADKRRILAIAGPAASGKSTVFALYERFYDVTRGRVLIDGYDVRDLKLQHLRRNIGLVTKSPFFFDATIRDNLTYGVAGPGEIIAEEKIIRAAKLAMAHDFILSLPQRYDTMIGPKGIPLTIRQKQRLAFARALIRDPCILLIDEPKIYNEPEESRKSAEDVLDQACEGRTCIVLARSKYIMQHSDCVAFMGDGKIIEMGSPEKILAAKGIEYELKHRG